MRMLVLVLFLLVILTQYPLWWGKGGWFRLQELRAQAQSLTEANEALLARNNALQAEVRDLEKGSAAIEERARGELNMIREGEYFVQVLPAP